MKRWAWAVAALVLIPVLAAYAQDRKKLDRQTIVNSCDRNLDGRIDREEWHVRLTEVFFFIDGNKDGFVVLDEVKATMREANPERFKAADKDGDGRLSLSEFHKAVAKDFDEADLNDDGVLDPSEIDRMLSER